MKKKHLQWKKIGSTSKSISVLHENESSKKTLIHPKSLKWLRLVKYERNRCSVQMLIHEAGLNSLLKPFSRKPVAFILISTYAIPHSAPSDAIWQH